LDRDRVTSQAQHILEKQRLRLICGPETFCMQRAKLSVVPVPQQACTIRITLEIR